MEEVLQKNNTPKNLKNFKGQFVVFFSDVEDPHVLFNSYIAEEAYKFAEEIAKKEKKEPIVYRVQEENVNMAAKIAH